MEWGKEKEREERSHRSPGIMKLVDCSISQKHDRVSVTTCPRLPICRYNFVSVVLNKILFAQKQFAIKSKYLFWEKPKTFFSLINCGKINVTCRESLCRFSWWGGEINKRDGDLVYDIKTQRESKSTYRNYMRESRKTCARAIPESRSNLSRDAKWNI